MTEAGKVSIAVALIGAATAVGVRLIGNGPGTAAPVAGSGPGTPPPLAMPDLSGAWIDKDGDALVIAAAGKAFVVTDWSFADFVKASGSVDGHSVRLVYTTKATTGSCAGTLADDGKAIDLACDEPGNRYAQRLQRR